MKLKQINKKRKCPACKQFRLEDMREYDCGYDFVCDGPLGCHAKFVIEDKK